MPKTLQQVKDEPLKTLIETAEKAFDEKYKCLEECDGHGNIPIAVDDGNGGRDWEAQQCQFHAEYLFPIKQFLTDQLTLAFSSGVHTTEERIKEEIKKLRPHWNNDRAATMDETLDEVLEALTSNSTQE